MTGRLARVLLAIALISAWAAEAAVSQEPALPSPGASIGPPTDEPALGSQPSADDPVVWLRGPFGKVAGGTVERPASAAPDARPLDTFVRHAPLLLEVEGGEPFLARLEVVARPVEAGREPEVLARGLQAFEGPSVPGRQVIVATLPVGEHVVERAWLVDVPDREPPDDGLYDLPAPRIIVSTASDRRAGSLGDGCYVYLCVETGQPIPPEDLVPMMALTGETPTLSVSDGSAIVAWEGSLTPLGRTEGRRLEAAGVVTEAPTSSLPLTGLEPMGPGRWLLEVEVMLDRERGWLRTSNLLVVA
jgi:hypothetical protein